MKLYRQTISGCEYWCSKTKKIIFVPKGKELQDVVGVDLGTGKDMTVTTELDTEQETEQSDDVIDLETMELEQLLTFAKDNNINVPGNMKKEETIRKFVTENYNTVSDNE